MADPADEPMPAIRADPSEPTASVLREVQQERQRQQDAKGYAAGHDDAHRWGELAKAAAAYAIQSTTVPFSPHYLCRRLHEDVPSIWPWSRSDFRPKSPRSDLVRAAALLVAEIERLDRREVLGPHVGATRPAGDGDPC